MACRLVAIEMSKAGVPARAAFDASLTRSRQQIPALISFDALLIASMMASAGANEVVNKPVNKFSPLRRGLDGICPTSSNMVNA